MWPENLDFDPLGTWPGAPTSTRQRSLFSSTLSSTLAILRRELDALGAKNARVQIALAPEKFRQDGRPRADATPTSPALILTLDSKHGPLSYPCDTFDRWQDNLRAIALALEALRKVDRYGVTKRGEQYRGFLALEATAAPAGFTTSADAIAFLRQCIPVDWTTTIGTDRSSLQVILRQAQRATHPDTGGDTATFQRVSLAETTLRREELI